MIALFIILAIQQTCAASLAGCQNQICKPFLFFWKHCQCAVPITITDDGLVVEPNETVYPPDLKCVIFNYRQSSRTITKENGKSVVYNVVTVQGVAVDDDKGKAYPPRIFDLHSVAMSSTDETEVLNKAIGQYEIGSIENCFPEVVDKSDKVTQTSFQAWYSHGGYLSGRERIMSAK